MFTREGFKTEIYSRQHVQAPAGVADGS